MLKLTINDTSIKVESNLTILEAARQAGIDIPNLCFIDGLDGLNSCRICVVEIEGRPNLAPACSTLAGEGMVIKTHSDRVINARRVLLELLLSSHPLDCLTCEKSGRCKLQDYCFEYGVKEPKVRLDRTIIQTDDTNRFYYYDPNKCIMCRKCVEVCSNLQCTDAIGFSQRGFLTHVAVPFEKRLSESDCVSCGNCVSVCPVGALMPKYKDKFRTWETQRVKTVCPYCGVGCEMELITKGQKVVGVEPAMGPANNGLLCVKGKFAFGFINHPDRLKMPLIKKDGRFIEATWDEAFEFVVKRIVEIKEKHGSDALAGLASAKCTNEENYLFQKLFRAALGTNNIDHCARLCHASTVSGLAATLGSGAMTNSINEVLDSDVIFILGSNTTESHPVIGSKIRQAKKRGAKIIVAEPRGIDLIKDAEIFLQIKPGTNVALLNGMMNVIIEEELQDVKYIESRTENYEDLKKVVSQYTPEVVAQICGIDPGELRKAARLYSKAERAGIYYSMGVTQHSTGTQGVMSVSNLALLCGNIGRESTGVNPLRGQNNVQGACDMGALPSDFPGYQKVFSPQAQDKFEKAWGVKLSNKAGLTVTEILDKAVTGEVKFLYIMGENPMISDPDINHVKEALQALDFLVVQDIFMTETAELADVILPAASFAEKDGTFTNTERRIQRVRRAVDPVREAREDWKILIGLANRLGYDMNYSSPSGIMDEIASLTPQYGGLNYERINDKGLQWPCPAKDHPGTQYLHKDVFAIGKALFKPAHHIESAELPDKDFPFLLTTGRMLYHYHTRTMTGKTEGLNDAASESYIEMNPVDADKLGAVEGERLKVSSRRGSLTTRLKITGIVEEGVVFMPFHFADGAANILTNGATDPVAKIPEFKVCAVRIEKF